MTEYKVRIEYTMTGDVCVEVEFPEEIEDAALDEMTGNPHCSLTDWDIGTPQEVYDD